ncbi:IS21-like element helper ATPase IstB [Streptomyces collinus]|uniref:IS21-like element helper ATPase IstB n=1 Tax=Streptomyces collinus TaxID=42684 RepID=UPI0037886FFA
MSTSTMQMSEARRFQQLRGHLSYRKLNAAAEALNRVLDQARTERMSLTAALERLLEIEAEATEARRLAARLRFACLPEPWTLNDFDFAAQPGVDEKLIRDLATLRFLDDASNVLFVGPPGVGETMLSVALGRAAVDAGHRVYCTTAAELAAKCHKAALEGRWKTCMRFFAGPKLLIIDELGYLPLPEDGASARFQVINQRYLKSSTILTANVGTAERAGAFGDATLAAAMLDRLLHRAAVAGRRRTLLPAPQPPAPGRHHPTGSERPCLLTPTPRSARNPPTVPSARARSSRNPARSTVLRAANRQPTDSRPRLRQPIPARSASAHSPSTPACGRSTARPTADAMRRNSATRPAMNSGPSASANSRHDPRPHPRASTPAPRRP